MLDKILELTNATPSGGFGSFVGHCPTHNDKNKSLSIKDSDGRILVKCHANCTQEVLIDYFKDNDAWFSEKIAVKKDKLEFAKNLWDSSKNVTENNPASKYLSLRGLKLDKFPNSLKVSSNCYNSELKKNTNALVAKIRKIDGEILGVQRIYVDDEGNKLKVDSPKKVLGSFSGGYVELKANKSSSVIHLTEGIETGLAIWHTLNETVLCAVCANNLSMIHTDKTVKTIHIWADKDASGTGQREAEKAAREFSKNGIEVFVHLPIAEIPDGAKSIDFLDVYNKDPKEITADKNRGKLFNNDILPIKMPSYDLPKPNDQYFPYIIRDWVFNEAGRLNVASETIAVPLFSVFGSLLGVKLAIQPKKNDYWKVYANLWGVIIAPPGTKKSAILNTSVKILNQIETEENQKALEKASAFVNDLHEINVKMIDIKKKQKEAILKDDEEEKKRCLKEFSELEKKEKELKVVLKRYSTSAFSIEKLMDMLADNPNGLLISRDELSGLFESFKKKGQETTRQFLLEGWNGDSSFNYDILSRPTRPLEKVCITILGGTQPSVINKMLTEMRKDQNDDGFIQRIQLIAYPNQDIVPEFVDKGLDKELQRKIKQLFEEFCNLDGSKYGEKHPDDNSFITKLSPEAYARFSAYMDSNEKEVHRSENGGYKNHIGKFGKLFSGLILIFHVIDNIETKRVVHKAPLHVVDMAILWCELFKAHAKKLYDTEYNFESLSGFALAKKINEGKVEDGSSLRSLHRNGWTNLTSIQEVESACQFLEKHNWLSVAEEKPTSGRPSNKIKFNQNLLSFLGKGKWHE